mgnify:CR=1 FL=1
MNLDYLNELKKNLKKGNHKNIVICLRKMFNGSEDTNIEGKEFEYLKFLFNFDIDKLYNMERIYFMYAISEEGVAIKNEYESKRHYDEEPFALVFNKYLENEND